MHRARLVLFLFMCLNSRIMAQENLPPIIPDPDAKDWVVDRFAGNSTAGPVFFQGPARESGGLARCGACPLPDGRVLLLCPEGIAEVDESGQLRLVVAGRFHYGTTTQMTAGVMSYNPNDKHVYVPGPNCVRRLVERTEGPWTVEVVAGTPGKAGADDGPVAKATFSRIDSVVANSRGVLFVLDDNKRLRKIENGVVSTLNAAIASGSIVDGPLETARFRMLGLGGNICAGDDDDTLYISDHWNYAVRKIDLKANQVTTVGGMPNPKGKTPRELRINANSDGPALTWASFNSGCAYVCWDPIHRAVWCGGPDEERFRWLKDGEVRTVVGAKGSQGKWNRNALGTPADDVKMVWNSVVAVDQQGRVYLQCGDHPAGIWRAYNRKEIKQ